MHAFSSPVSEVYGGTWACLNLHLGVGVDRRLWGYKLTFSLEIVKNKFDAKGYVLK